MSVWIVVGGQYGSEGKGKISAYIALHEEIDICVRCGGPNSGHSFVDDQGSTQLVRQVPTGFVSPRARLLIPAGGLVSPAVLKAEVELLRLNPARLGIDRNAILIEDYDIETEQRLGLRSRLSSTLCGVGAAAARRVMRGSDVTLASGAAGPNEWMRSFLTDVSEEVNRAVDSNKRVLVEGTQGFGLSLYHTAEYPKATSRDTTAAGFLSEVGLSPRVVTEIVIVFRTFPIRVAGYQAGQLRDEISWEILQAESGYPHAIKEFTSVTNLPRRLARFDWQLAERACSVNRPTRIAVTGLDYIDYGSYGRTEISELPSRAKSFLKEIATRFTTPVSYLSTSPRLEHTFEVRSRVESAQLSGACA